MDVAAVEKLPPESISSKPIRERAAVCVEARSAKEQARKDLTELEQTREAAEWRDAEAAERARAAGEAEPKRSQVADHDKKTDAARHRLKIETLAEERAVNELQAVVEEHGPAWVESLDAELATIDDAWIEQVDAPKALHSQREAVSKVRKNVYGPSGRPILALGFTPQQLNGVDVIPVEEHGRRVKQRASILTEDVLAELSKLGKRPEPEPTRSPVEHPPPFGQTSKQKATTQEAIERGVAETAAEREAEAAEREARERARPKPRPLAESASQ